MRKRVTFTGHFNLGERINPRQLATVADALEGEGDLAVLVGDIGFAGNVLAYAGGGEEAVAAIHAKRRACATTGCIRQQVPEAVDDIVPLIDEDLYKGIVSTHNTLGKDFTEQVKASIPAIIDERLKAYGLEGNDVKVYSETQMRNIVMRRTRGSNEKNPESWRRLPQFLSAEKYGGKECFLAMEEIVSAHGSPLCRGIMLALYETLASDGYERIVQLYPAEQRQSVEMATRLYEVLGKENPEEERWNRLTFENRFYGGER